MFSAKTVKIDNLPIDCSEEALLEAFQPYGQIIASQKTEGETFGYIMYKNYGAAGKAAAPSNSIAVSGNTVQVTRHLNVANPSPKNKQQGLLENSRNRNGAVGRSSWKDTGTNSKDSNAQRKAGQTKKQVDFANALPIALVEGIAADASQDSIRKMFESAFGPVLRVNVVKVMSKTHTYVEFSNFQDMHKAIDASGTKTLNKKTWTVSYCENRGQTQKVKLLADVICALDPN